MERNHYSALGGQTPQNQMVVGSNPTGCQTYFFFFSLPTRWWNWLNEFYREIKKLKLNEYQDVLHDADLAQK